MSLCSTLYRMISYILLTWPTLSPMYYTYSAHSTCKVPAHCLMRFKRYGGKSSEFHKTCWIMCSYSSIRTPWNTVETCHVTSVLRPYWLKRHVSCILTHSAYDKLWKKPINIGHIEHRYKKAWEFSPFSPIFVSSTPGHVTPNRVQQIVSQVQ